MIDTPPRARALDVEALPVLSTLSRAALPILGAAVLAGAAAYIVTSAQPKVYQANSSLFSSNSSANQFDGSLVAAPTLPRGALRQALTSPTVIKDVIEQVKATGLPAGQVQTIVSSLKSELTAGNVTRLQLVTVDESNTGGVYVVSGRADTPAGARVLTNAGVNALVNWDTQRARTRIARARASIQRQLTTLNTETPDNNVYSAAYESVRAQLLQDLNLTSARANSAVGTLDVVSEAIDPSSPSAPRPLRSAVLSALLALLTAMAVALILANMQRPAPRRVERYQQG